MANVRSEVQRRPAGTIGVLAGAVVVVAGKLGLDLTAEEAAVLVSALVALVSLISPLPLDRLLGVEEEPVEESFDEFAG